MLIEGRNQGVVTFEEVEAQLVEVVDLWRRSPGQGRWPFATDGPWHLMTREVRASSAMEAWRIEASEEDEAKPLPLTRAEVAMRDQVSEWLGMVEEVDRRIVVLALADLARGRRVGWRRMLPKLGLKMGADGLRRRYERAISSIAQQLTRKLQRSAA